jgi:hypothetical protein
VKPFDQRTVLNRSLNSRNLLVYDHVYTGEPKIKPSAYFSLGIMTLAM